METYCRTAWKPIAVRHGNLLLACGVNLLTGHDVIPRLHSQDLTWLWHAPGSAKFPVVGFGSNAIVEVTHHKDPFGDEHFGMWFLYAKGSGVFLDIGTTKVLAEHHSHTCTSLPMCTPMRTHWPMHT